MNVEEAKERLLILEEFVKSMMIQGQDYGLIPGCNKPSLFKPGAEKLCDVFGFSKKVEIINRYENWEKPFVHYEVKVILTDKKTGQMEAEGIGSCNSMEKKYANQNTYNICNTLIKIAKKRALIDAILSATNSSGIFTQDIEDLDLAGQRNRAEPVTDNQLKKLFVLVNKLGFSNEQIKNIMYERYKVDYSHKLSKENALDLIKYLSERVG